MLPLFIFNPFLEQQAIQVAILDLKDVYDKFQRKGSSSEQRIANGRVTGVAWTTIHQVEKIEAFVQRTPEAANKVGERLYVGKSKVNFSASIPVLNSMSLREQSYFLLIQHPFLI